MINKSILFLIAFAAALFTACGDDSNSASNNSEQAGCSVVDNKDGSYTLSCGDGSEVTLYDGVDGADGKNGADGTDGKNGADGTNGANGKDGTNGKNGVDGTDGANGKDGADGANGSDCTVADTTDESAFRTGYKLICGTEVVGVVWNGVDGIDGSYGDDGEDGPIGDHGQKGADGLDGTSCTASDTTDDATGRTGYKLMCGTEHKGTVWNGINGASCIVKELPYGAGYKILCGGDSVGVVLNANGGMCGSNAYSLTSQVCNSYDNKVYNKCGPSKLYDPSTYFCDTRDERIYKIVTIGTQTWMAENLNHETENGSRCYNDSLEKCFDYGRLYEWDAASTACPEGWHLPSSDEWKSLFTAVGGIPLAGTVLKSTTEWYDNGNGTDSYGFGVLPAGIHNSDGDFVDFGSHAYFWSSTESDSDRAFLWHFEYDFEEVVREEHTWDGGFSVRCLKDED